MSANIWYLPGRRLRTVNCPSIFVLAMRSKLKDVIAESAAVEYTPTSIPCAGSSVRASSTIPDMHRVSIVSPVENAMANPSRMLPSLRSLTASARSIVYVVLGCSVSRNSTVTLRPFDETDGCWIGVGDITTFSPGLSSWIFSSKYMLTRPLVTLRLSGAGVDDANFGGVSSRGPPSGRPMLAQAATRMPVAIVAGSRYNLL
ncbi:hypothetical protein IMSAGC006_01160 [Muribaculaceae bacterium]|nr:hypothetical protein IMSAGC006_01160 [Muribaculaceae bacterium]